MIVVLLLGCFHIVFAEANPVVDQSTQDQSKITEDNVSKNTQDVMEAITKQADFVYTYVPNQVYKVYCSENRITDIQFQPGEEILYIGGADTIRWILDKDVSGTGVNKQWHLFVKPQKPDISTNFIVTTDRHTYHLDVYAKTWSTPIINWTYPQEERLTIMRQQERQREIDTNEIHLGQDNLSLDSMNFKYKIDGRNYPWKPLLVFDDGSKTYIQMPASMRSSEAPALFIKDGKNLLLVNYRVKNGYYIIDRLFEEAEMRNGPKEIIKIKKSNR